MTAERSAPPALVLGSDVTALGVTRVLGRAGVRVYVSTEPDELVRRSRWFRAAPGPPYTGDGLEAYLRQLPLARAVLVPCYDHAALAVARLDPALADRFPSCMAPAPVLERFLDKAKFRDLLERLDIARPRTYRVSSCADLDAIPDAFFASAFLKPHDSQSFFARYGVKAFRTASREDACRRLASAAAEGLEVVLQEYVPGPPDNHYLVDGFADREARIRALFGRRRFRMYPLDFGNTSYMRSVALEDVAPAVQSLERIIAHLHYRGIFSAEFKRDALDGTFKLLEVNVRPWWYVEFAARCGVDVCRMFYKDALGEPINGSPVYAVGKRLVYPYFDYFAGRAARAAGTLSFRQWAASWIGATQPVFCWDDVGPSLAWTSRWLGRRARRLY